jgi:hypothetical protein
MIAQEVVMVLVRLSIEGCIDHVGFHHNKIVAGHMAHHLTTAAVEAVVISRG